MFIGVEIDLYLHDSDSLKDKRKIIKSIIERSRSRYHVSAAEIGDHDLWNRSRLGFALVSNDYTKARTLLEKMLEKIEEDYALDILALEWFS